jgi:hypothetical protein
MLPAQDGAKLLDYGVLGNASGKQCRRNRIHRAGR